MNINNRKTTALRNLKKQYSKNQGNVFVVLIIIDIIFLDVLCMLMGQIENKMCVIHPNYGQYLSRPALICLIKEVWLR